ncbi:MAG: VirB3 family type IV secretion system protein [Burkholderiaceae bacterium]|nr:VirB3 family type IV secretion system protein [Burkholderiaceae bacterium]
MASSARRDSVFHGSLNRPQLYAGVPRAAFMVVVLGGMFLFVARLYHGVPAALLLWALARWLTRRDPAWLDILVRYLEEAHAYDSLPRPRDCQRRPRGWGRGLPW